MPDPVPLPTDPLAGLAALVTGGGRGIGRCIVRRLAAEGCAVTVADVDEPAGRAVVDEVTAAGGRCRFRHTDLADRQRRDALVDEVVDTWGHLDVLVNNAAYLGRRNPVASLGYADWDAVVETNLTAAVFLARDAAGAMDRRGGGAIVNIASIQENLPLPTHVPYVTSKGGVTALTRALAVELGPRGIRVNAVAPGGIETPAMAETRTEVGLPGSAAADSPALLGRPGQPAEVAEAVAYLASPRASYITGAVLTVDGGRSLSRRPDALGAGLDAGAGR